VLQVDHPSSPVKAFLVPISKTGSYNFARRLKTLNGLTPYEYLCKIWTREPARFIMNPNHQMPGLNT
ncbi:MAG: hypothetical protein LBF93_06335, partial [Zoogloeaceae bacterium]|nr:hypothetical protein [Zoogloeaceae bacterium]